MPNNENENVSTVNETIVTGKKYRVLKDKINGLWNRISFWTSANDVEFTDSGSLQGKRLNEVVTSIQNSAGVPGDSVVILDNNDAVPEGWELTTKPQDIVDLENAVDDLNDNLTTINNNLGAKNMLPNNATSKTVRGVTYTVNSDGTITVSGTADSNNSYIDLVTDLSLPNGEYTFTCENADIHVYAYALIDGKQYNTFNGAVNFTINNQVITRVRLVSKNGYPTSTITVKVMIRPASIKDDTYAPYAQTNKELTDNLTWYIQNGWLPVRPSGDVPANMEDCSWAMLKQLAAADTLKNYYQIGDTKTIELNGGERVVMELVSINDGSGTAGGYYPRGTVDFISKDCLQTTRSMNSSNTNAGGWVNCALRTTLNTTIYETLPQTVKDALVEKTHKTSAGSQSTSLVEHTDKLWLPTEYEMFGAITYSANTENANVNKHYAVFDTNADRIKHQGTNGSAVGWWESSPLVSYSTGFCLVGSGGSAGNGTAGYSDGVPLCFRIGQLYT